MAFIVEDGIGVLDANSYVSVEFADDYFETHPFYKDNWRELTEEDKQSLLIYASSFIDSMVTWAGTRLIVQGGLAWPRLISDDYGRPVYPDTVIPVKVKQAVCEIAVYLTLGDFSQEPESIGLEELKIDVIQLKFDNSERRAVLPSAALRLLRGLAVSNNMLKVGYVSPG